MKKIKIIIIGGHLTPALSIIEKLLKNNKWQILFIGRKHTMEGDRAASIESKIIPKLGIDFVSINAGRIQRRLTRYFFPSLLKIPLGFFQALYYVGKFRPNIILSFGGYLSVPVALAGWLFGVPIITHEQSVVPGLATKFIAFFAKKVAISWKESFQYFSKKKAVLTGNPIREEILQLSSHLTIQPSNLPIIYITGGNQGAHAINKVVGKCLPRLLKKYQVIHQCGMVEYYRDDQKLKLKMGELKPELQKRYELKKWFSSKEVAEILRRADLVVSRAGANTVCELAYLGKPALLIPLFFGKEQERNAKILANIGSAEILPQEELTVKTLLQWIDILVRDIKKYQKKGERAKKLIKINASERLVEEIEKCLNSSIEDTFF